MLVGRLFTFQGHRYEPGDTFNIGGVPEYRRSSFVRLYGLSEQPPKPRKSKKMKADEPLEDFIPSEPAENGEQDE